MAINWYQATLAIGALGTAATGLVDTTKVFGGGISRAGFGYIKHLIARTVGLVSDAQPGAGLATGDILDTLLANWMNGMETGAQKAIAKSFIKLHLNPATAAAFARETNVSRTRSQVSLRNLPLYSRSRLRNRMRSAGSILPSRRWLIAPMRERISSTATPARRLRPCSPLLSHWWATPNSAARSDGRRS